MSGSSTLPSDAALTEAGLTRSGQGRVLLVACGALAREILALKSANGWDHMDLQCLPAKLHLYPDQIPDAVEAVVQAARQAYETVFVVYADCGTGGQLQARCDALGVQMVPGPHCYSFFDGNEAFASRGDDEMTAFFLTDFLVRQFDAFVWRPLGLDRHPELRDAYFGHYDRLIYLQQIEDDDLIALASEAADRLGLAFEHRRTGYGDLVPILSGLAPIPAS